MCHPAQLTLDPKSYVLTRLTADHCLLLFTHRLTKMNTEDNINIRVRSSGGEVFEVELKLHCLRWHAPALLQYRFDVYCRCLPPEPHLLHHPHLPLHLSLELGDLLLYLFSEGSLSASLLHLQVYYFWMVSLVSAEGSGQGGSFGFEGCDVGQLGRF